MYLSKLELETVQDGVKILIIDNTFIDYSIEIDDYIVSHECQISGLFSNL